jgi:hypothetical protein
MVGNAAIAVAKPKEERSFRREIMTASVAGLPQDLKSLLALPVLVLIYVIGRLHSHPPSFDGPRQPSRTSRHHRDPVQAINHGVSAFGAKADIPPQGRDFRV